MLTVSTFQNAATERGARNPGATRTGEPTRHSPATGAPFPSPLLCYAPLVRVCANPEYAAAVAMDSSAGRIPSPQGRTSKLGKSCLWGPSSPQRRHPERPRRRRRYGAQKARLVEPGDL